MTWQVQIRIGAWIGAWIAVSGLIGLVWFVESTRHRESDEYGAAIAAAAQRLQAADLARGRAESRAVDADALNESLKAELAAIRKDLDGAKVEATRASRAELAWKARYQDLAGRAEWHGTKQGAIRYAYEWPWGRFATPDVFKTGGETVELNLTATVSVVGLRLADARTVEAETVAVMLADPTGKPLETQPVLTSYRFDYVADAPQKPSLLARWRVAARPVAGVSLPYPWAFDRATARLGIEAGAWDVRLRALGVAGLSELGARFEVEYAPNLIRGGR